MISKYATSVRESFWAKLSRLATVMIIALFPTFFIHTISNQVSIHSCPFTGQTSLATDNSCEQFYETVKNSTINIDHFDDIFAKIFGVIWDLLIFVLTVIIGLICTLFGQPLSFLSRSLLISIIIERDMFT